ncbi:hypothetical protein N657DRAFT_200226 [Parathielavia appendiculata]|uniref:Uncharacterized protein n=1 Tax=Parathielavia appendiculata TaxID=2587402 RepID=A0AAN6Z680_9PEZI|nr:hypothetical protein N657DRAFT_200226 [Parathielavia appendiculata]
MYCASSSRCGWLPVAMNERSGKRPEAARPRGPSSGFDIGQMPDSRFRLLLLIRMSDLLGHLTGVLVSCQCVRGGCRLLLPTAQGDQSSDPCTTSGRFLP